MKCSVMLMSDAVRLKVCGMEGTSSSADKDVAPGVVEKVAAKTAILKEKRKAREEKLLARKK